MCIYMYIYMSIYIYIYTSVIKKKNLSWHLTSSVGDSSTTANSVGSAPQGFPLSRHVGFHGLLEVRVTQRAARCALNSLGGS